VWSTSSCVELFGEPCEGSPIRLEWKRTQDYVKKERHPVSNLLESSDFDSRHVKYGFNRFNIHTLDPYGQVQYSGTQMKQVDDEEGPKAGWATVEPADSVLVAELLARTSPFRYELSVPVLVSELVEATTLLKLATNNFVSLIGSSYLNYKFGWSTLISDIKSLANLTETIESRIREFNSLLGPSGLSRSNIKLFQTSGSWTGREVYMTTSLLQRVGGRQYVAWKTKIWGSVRWFPKRDDLIPVEPLERFNLAVRQVLDLEYPDPETVWEAIPFSWLIDYFLNVGPTLQAVQDLDELEPRHICLMRERVTTTTWTDVRIIRPAKTVSVEPGTTRVTEKLRTVMDETSLADAFTWSFFTEEQALTLSALLASFLKYKS
jgi:hypothetical protein